MGLINRKSAHAHRRGAPRRRGAAERHPRAGALAARQADGDDLPGPAVLAAPLLLDRQAARRRPSWSTRTCQEGRSRAGEGHARPGGHPQPGPPDPGLPAQPLRRHAPARDDRDGAAEQPRAAHRRRADDRARRHRPGADHRPAARPAEGVRHGDRADHPRPRCRRRHGRRRGGHVRRAHRRARRRSTTSTTAPEMPYTWGLLGSVPRMDVGRGERLEPIPGQPPSLIRLPKGCVFRPRCPYHELVPGNRCDTERPDLLPVTPEHAVRCHLEPAQRKEIAIERSRCRTPGRSPLRARSGTSTRSEHIDRTVAGGQVTAVDETGTERRAAPRGRAAARRPGAEVLPDHRRRHPQAQGRRRQGRREHLLRHRARRDAGHRRRERMRQVHRRTHGHEAARPDRRQGRVRGPGHHQPHAQADGPAAPRDADDLPGPVLVAEPAAHRRHDHLGAVQGAGRQAGPRRAGRGAGPDGPGGPEPRALQPLSQRVLRRPAPAHRHRPRHRAAAQADRVRRARVGARRVDPGAGRQPARGPAGRVRPRVHLHRPRPVGRAPHLRPDRGDVPRPDHGDRRRGADLHRAACTRTPTR